jgi:hypothetical protein
LRNFPRENADRASHGRLALPTGGRKIGDCRAMRAFPTPDDAALMHSLHGAMHHERMQSSCRMRRSNGLGNMSHSGRANPVASDH